MRTIQPGSFAQVLSRPTDYESAFRVSTASTQYTRVYGFSQLRVRFAILSRKAGRQSIGLLPALLP